MRSSTYSPLTACAVLVGTVLAAPARAAAQDTTGVGSLSGVGGVPVLYTVNAKAVYDLSASDRIWAVNVTGIDRIRLGLTDSTPNDEEIFNLDIRYRGWRSGTGVNWQHLSGSRGVGLAGVTNSVARVRQTVKDLVRNGVPPTGTPADQVIESSPLVYRADSIESETTAKYDATVTASSKSKVQFGGSVKQFRVNYDSAAPLGFDTPYSVQPGVDPFRIDDRFTAWQSGTYAQVTHDLTSALNITGGGRFDRYQYIDASRFSPRLAATVTVTPRFSIKASTGIYYQQPAFQFLAVFQENRALKPFRADHYVGGVAYTLAADLVLSAEAYRKNYHDYPVSTEYPSLSLANLGDTFNVLESLFPLTSAGFGRSQGLEFNLTKKDDGRWYGLANVSISKAQHAARDGVLRPGSFDYPFVLNVTGGRRWSPKWESSLKLSYLSGRPYTPFDLAESTRQRRGIYDLSRINAARAPAYFRFDARRPERDDRGKTGHRVLGHPERHWTAQRQRVRMEPTGECRGAARTARRVPVNRARMAVLTPNVRKFALTAHVTSSVGWLGAVATFLVLAVAGLMREDDQMVRSVYLATELTTWFVIVPLAFASLLTGLVVALGTQWGLCQHYWVLVKFMLTIFATTLLLLHTQPIGRLAAVARETTVPGADIRALQIQIVGDAGAALLALLINVTLSIYRPSGMTAYGRRRQQEQRQPPGGAIRTESAPVWIKVLALAVVGLMVAFVVLHLAGSGLGALHHR